MGLQCQADARAACACHRLQCQKSSQGQYSMQGLCYSGVAWHMAVKAKVIAQKLFQIQSVAAVGKRPAEMLLVVDVQDFHDQVEYDGIWIDMNEVSNYCSGDVCQDPGTCPNTADLWVLSCPFAYNCHMADIIRLYR